MGKYLDIFYIDNYPFVVVRRLPRYYWELEHNKPLPIKLLGVIGGAITGQRIIGYDVFVFRPGGKSYSVRKIYEGKVINVLPGDEVSLIARYKYFLSKEIYEQIIETVKV